MIIIYFQRISFPKSSSQRLSWWVSSTVVANRCLICVSQRMILGKNEKIVKINKRYIRYSMYLFSPDATIFLKKKYIIVSARENIKRKLPSKVAYLWQFLFFFSTAPTAKNSPGLKIHIINTSQNISVYWSVVSSAVCTLSSFFPIHAKQLCTAIVS